MKDVKTLRRHAALVDSMATARGVDLEEAVLRGNMPLDGIADAVLKCTGCANPEDCEQWLASRDGVQPTTPGYCRNSDLFKDLIEGRQR